MLERIILIIWKKINSPALVRSRKEKSYYYLEVNKNENLQNRYFYSPRYT